MFSTKKNIFNKVSPMNVSMIAEAHGLSDSKARDMVIQINEELNDSSEIINNGGLINLLKRTENERFCDRAISDWQFNSSAMEKACVQIMDEATNTQHSKMKM